MKRVITNATDKSTRGLSKQYKEIADEIYQFHLDLEEYAYYGTLAGLQSDIEDGFMDPDVKTVQEAFNRTLDKLKKYVSTVNLE